MTSSDRTAFSWASPGMDEFAPLDRLSAPMGEFQRGTAGLLRETQSALRDSEDRFRSVIHSLPAAVYICDAQGRITLYNEAAVALWGRRPELNQDLWCGSWRIHDPVDGSPVALDTCPMAIAIREGRSIRGRQIIVERPDGTRSRVLPYPDPIRDAYGTIVGAVNMLVDLSDQDRAEAEKRRLEENLRQAQKLEAVGQLSGGLAHDFNNLLTVIQGHVGLLGMNGGLPEAAADSLREIGRAATRAASLTQQLLAFSRKQVMQMRHLDLNDLVKDLAKMLGRVLREDISLELGFSVVPMVVNADAGMVEQAVINLVVNARDAMPSGGRLVVTVVAAEFDEDAAGRPVGTQAGTFVRLSVKDSGIGIAPEVLPKIFEPFFTTKDIGKGSGLGLATAYGIVRQHGGWIDVESQPGKGTTFHIYLPRQAAEPAVNIPANDEPPIAQGAETVLLVEDEVLVRRIMATFLVRHGYKVLTAENGASACMVWQQYRDQIDLLVTDLVMPKGMGGRQLAEHLISDRPDLRVIYTSGYSPELAGKDLALREGTDFLPKPFDGRQLAAAVRTSLDRQN